MKHRIFGILGTVFGFIPFLVIVTAYFLPLGEYDKLDMLIMLLFFGTIPIILSVVLSILSANAVKKAPKGSIKFRWDILSWLSLTSLIQIPFFLLSPLNSLIAHVLDKL